MFIAPGGCRTILDIGLDIEAYPGGVTDWKTVDSDDGNEYEMGPRVFINDRVVSFRPEAISDTQMGVRVCEECDGYFSELLDLDDLDKFISLLGDLRESIVTRMSQR